MAKHCVWVVEGQFDPAKDYRPCVGIALTKHEALKLLPKWRARCPDDKFRVSRYVRARSGGGCQ